MATNHPIGWMDRDDSGLDKSKGGLTAVGCWTVNGFQIVLGYQKSKKNTDLFRASIWMVRRGQGFQYQLPFNPILKLIIMALPNKQTTHNKKIKQSKNKAQSWIYPLFPLSVQTISATLPSPFTSLSLKRNDYHNNNVAWI